MMGEMPAFLLGPGTQYALWWQLVGKAGHELASDAV